VKTPNEPSPIFEHPDVIPDGVVEDAVPLPSNPLTPSRLAAKPWVAHALACTGLYPAIPPIRHVRKNPEAPCRTGLLACPGFDSRGSRRQRPGAWAEPHRAWPG